MVLITPLALAVALGCSAAYAAPKWSLTPGGSNIASRCTDISLDGAWLIGNCLVSSNSTARIKSTVYLGYYIANTEAALKWKMDGGFQDSCSNCNLTRGGATLSCSCKHSTRGEDVSTLELDDHIAIYDGHLLSNLDGTPPAPTNSLVPVPSNFTYTMNLSIKSACANANSFWSKGPVKCYVFWNWSPTPQEFVSAQFSGTNPGYEAVLYDNSNCTGAPIDTVGLSQGSTCKSLAGKAVGIAVRPLWNSD